MFEEGRVKKDEIICLYFVSFPIKEIEYALRKFAPFNTHFIFTKDFTTRSSKIWRT